MSEDSLICAILLLSLWRIFETLQQVKAIVTKTDDLLESGSQVPHGQRREQPTQSYPLTKTNMSWFICTRHTINNEM